MKFQDLTGQKFGRLLVLERAENSNCGRTQWKCKCDCGNETIVISNQLKRGKTQSCGCYHKTHLANRIRKHGMTDTKLNIVWRGMKARCYYKKHKSYMNYGGKGITVCEKWKNDYLSFYNWALENGYQEGLTLDRINGSKGYSPSNCRWVTVEVQNNNKPCVRLITYNGETHTINEWSKITGINKRLIAQRVDNKFPVERLFLQPYRREVL